uniref:Uncharacterized protein n=1 Tax=Rhizophagus irregularis (strain DAOM 181602 / DAOM 197198 / MUCL 43194) TaxID=747089 RepID=U9U573_RHIID
MGVTVGPEKREKNEKNDTIIEDEDDEENSMISAAFSSEDDPTLSYLTFRFWVLSTFFTSLCAAISQFYHFHPNNGDFSPFLWCLYLMLLEDGWQEYYQRKNFKFCDGALVSTQDHSISKNTFVYL